MLIVNVRYEPKIIVRNNLTELSKRLRMEINYCNSINVSETTLQYQDFLVRLEWRCTIGVYFCIRDDRNQIKLVTVCGADTTSFRTTKMGYTVPSDGYQSDHRCTWWSFLLTDLTSARARRARNLATSKSHWSGSHIVEWSPVWALRKSRKQRWVVGKIMAHRPLEK